MDKQALRSWHSDCASVKGGPFLYVRVLVNKSTRTATVVFSSKPDFTVNTEILSKIGAGEANYTQIGQEIIAVAREHGLLDHTSETSIVDGDEREGRKS